MKILRKISWMVAILMVASMTFMSCTKEGPAGKDGKDGKDGINGLPGTPGTNGQDGTAGCIKCHDNSQVNFAITKQWERSGHLLGGNWATRNGTSCAVCHTSQGFREVITSGADGTAATITNPAPPNCYTCHNIHKTFGVADWALSKTTPVKMRIKTTETIDFGKANLCATCHQPRLPNPMPVIDGPAVTITSTTYGPHYGTQATILKGKGGVEFGTGYTNGPHSNLANNCVACHYVAPVGISGGGHMFNLGYLNTSGVATVITSSCTTCHPTAATLTTLMSTTKATLSALHTQLGDRLIALNVMDAATGSIKTGTHSAARAGAFINYRLVKYDRSNGVHNFAYAKKLMENSLAALQ